MKGRRLVVVGSTDFPLDVQVGGAIVDLLREWAPEVILTRGARGFDRFIIRVGTLLGIPVIQFTAKGASSNWSRDVELVEQGDAVIGFVSTTKFDEGKISGTQHVLEVGLNQKKPVRAYTSVDSKLVYAGELP